MTGIHFMNECMYYTITTNEVGAIGQAVKTFFKLKQDKAQDASARFPVSLAPVMFAAINH